MGSQDCSSKVSSTETEALSALSLDFDSILCHTSRLMTIPGSDSAWQERWHSVNEVAAHLGVSPDTVYRWIEGKDLPAHRIGGPWKCKLVEVDEWVRTTGGKHSGPSSKSKHKARRG